MHNFLTKKCSWYKAYHDSPYAGAITWTAFLAVATLYATSCSNFINHFQQQNNQIAQASGARSVQNISVSISANPAQIKQGQATRVSWTSAGARRCVTSNGLSGLSGSFMTPVLVTNVVYEVTCTRPGSRASSRLEIDINDTLVASTLSLNGPSSAQVGIPSESFEVSVNATPTEPIIVTPVSTVAGVFTPLTVTLASSTLVTNFTFTPNEVGSYSITLQNNNNLTNPVPLRLEVRPSLLESRMDLFRQGALRGFALSALPKTGLNTYTEKDFTDLVATGANIVRVPIHLDKNSAGTGYLMPTDDLSYVKNILEFGAARGFRVIVVLVPLPTGSGTDFWRSPSLREDIVRKWELIASELKGYQAILAYDLLNEPVIPGAERVSGLSEWHGFAVQLTRALQAVDPQTPVMFEPVPWGLPGSFWQAPALGLSGVVYSFHMYDPHQFTHQTLSGYPNPAVYPSGTWNATFLYDKMLEARKIAQAHNVPMFVGEFSCIRWAPQESCPTYLADTIKLFADQGWGWTYHAWRGYEGWDAEIPGTTPQVGSTSLLPQLRTSTSTSFVLLKQAMSQNSRQ